MNVKMECILSWRYHKNPITFMLTEQMIRIKKDPKVSRIVIKGSICSRAEPGWGFPSTKRGHLLAPMAAAVDTGLTRGT